MRLANSTFFFFGGTLTANENVINMTRACKIQLHRVLAALSAKGLNNVSNKWNNMFFNTEKHPEDVEGMAH